MDGTLRVQHEERIIPSQEAPGSTRPGVLHGSTQMPARSVHPNSADSGWMHKYAQIAPGTAPDGVNGTRQIVTVAAQETQSATEGLVEGDPCKRRSDNVPRRRLDSLTMAVENRTVCHLPIESIETLMEGDKDVHRGHVFARAQGVPGGGDEHQGGVPGVRAAPRHRAQDALAPRATGIPQEAPSPSPQA